jgi:hypothetical protein
MQGRPRLLEPGAGGGRLASHPKARFEMTPVDLTPRMPEQSHRPNPTCRYLVGDMRSFRLAESFDADLVCSLRDGTGASTVIDDRMTPDLCPRAAWMPLPAEAEFAPVEKQQQSGRDPFPARR